MSFVLRPYQIDAVKANVGFFRSNAKHNELQILPTGSGKSLVIANTVAELSGPTLIFQPSKEILVQNFQKYLSYGYRAGIYSASAGLKHRDRVTFATIGSVIKKKHLFSGIENIIIDECHLVNPEEGMYRDFVTAFPKAKVLGLTATPYRLASAMDGAELRFLTRTRPRIFNKVNYYVQNDVLFNAGHLAPLEYYSFNVVDRSRLEMNKSGTDFTEQSIRSYFRTVNMPQVLADKAKRILQKRKNLLVFCSLVSEAYEVAKMVPEAVVLHGETEGPVRDQMLRYFKSGKINCVVNVGVLTTGFDYPELEAVLIGRSTMSLALYYQIVGRVMRPYKYPDGAMKTGWVVDCGGNINFFGKIETMKIGFDAKGLFIITNNGRQLTNVPFTKD
ncbi:MAG: DEAD/DEAH box helicase [Bacteroidetes bacterium]|nr:DEAD/DEAH box helicase [Bacteroidota bacterium]